MIKNGILDMQCYVATLHKRKEERKEDGYRVYKIKKQEILRK